MALLRIISGLPTGTEGDGTCLEADKLPLDVMWKLRSIKTREKMLRQKGLSDIVNKAPPPEVIMLYGKERTRIPTPFEEAAKLTKEICEWANVPGGIDHARAPRLFTPTIPPWTQFPTNITFNMHVSSGKKKSAYGKEQQLAIVNEAMDSIGAFDLLAATDGSVERVKRVSGTASLIFEWADMSTAPTLSSEIGWTRAEQKLSTGGPLAASKTAESIALRDALQLLLDITRQRVDQKQMRIVIVSDSSSCITALSSGPLSQCSSTDEQSWILLKELASLVSNITIQHVWSHCGFWPNEAADAEAADATEMVQDCPIELADFMSAAKEYLKGIWLQKVCDSNHSRVRTCGTLSFAKMEREAPLSRQQEITASRIRTDTLPLLAGYWRRLNPLVPRSCRFCCQQDHLTRPPPLVKARSKEEEMLLRHSEARAPCLCCDHIASCRGNLFSHMKRYHRKEYEAIKTRMKQRKTKLARKAGRPPTANVCDLCGRHYGSPTTLTKHKQKIHGVVPRQVIRPPSSGPDETIEHLMVRKARPIARLREKHLIDLFKTKKLPLLKKYDWSHLCSFVMDIQKLLKSNATEETDANDGGGNCCPPRGTQDPGREANAPDG